MKRLPVLLMLTLLLGACAGDTPETRTLRLGATAGPFADQIRWGIRPLLEAKGYRVLLTEFSDYVQPNIALAEGSLDANTFQHVVYLEKFAADRELPIQPLVQVPTAPLGLYSRRHNSLDALADGHRIAMPNDPTNQARALVMLEKLGWIALKPEVDPLRASEHDIAANPRGLRLVPLEAAQLPRSLDDVDFSFVNGNFAVASGLKLSEALKLEDLPERYLNVVAIRTADAGQDWVRDLAEAYRAPAFRALIAERFQGFVLPQDWH